MPNSRPSGLGMTFLVGVVLSLLAFSYLGLRLFLGPSPNQVTSEICKEFEQNRGRFTEIARLVSGRKGLGTPAQPTAFEISADRDPQSIRLIDENDPTHLVIRMASDTERLIQGWREQDGRVIVKIIMKHWNHGGHWYLLYSNPPSKPGEKFGPADQVTQLDPNWRCFYDPND